MNAFLLRFSVHIVRSACVMHVKFTLEL